MKKILFGILLTGCANALFAQTAGTNTLGFGINAGSSEQTSGGGSTNTAKVTSTSIGYGHFIKDNARLGFTFTMTRQKNSVSGSAGSASTYNLYGGEASYQYYYPVFKKFYVFAGAKGGYASGKQEQESTNVTATTDDYSLGGYGGATYFLSKRFAFETNLLSATARYSRSKQDGVAGIPNSGYKVTTKSFNLTTTGFVNDLGFSIYLLF